MKIDVNQIPLEGLTLQEDIAVASLDLETEIIKFSGPIKIKADISKITNVVSVDLTFEALMHTSCSRCLAEFEIDLKKNLKLNYSANRLEPVIDLGPDVREEIILNYPLRPLCSPNCKGLCSSCGKNLNEGGCSCGFT